jgi:Leucine-rich repeat (LRR) protein
MRRFAVRVRELAVASSALETLPEWLGELARLELLRLEHAPLEKVWVGNRWERKREGCDRLTALPDGIRVLTVLKTLNLSRCKGLTGLPEGLSALTALQTLNLGGCKRLKVLPEGLSAMTALQTLYLIWCQGLTGLPEGLSALTALQTLDLRGCRGLTALPEVLSALTALQKLGLSLCREQTSLPEGLSALTALQTLDLYQCSGLTGLPKGLSALTALQTLYLRECTGLTGLPEGLSALTALQTLDLNERSGLTGLPEGLSALTALQTLNLSRCKGLTGLPERLSALTALQTLNLRECKGLTGLPEGLLALTALQTLDLRECKGLTELPEGLSALTALQTLDLYECSGLTGLPEGLSALTALQTLALGGCAGLTGLPEGLSALTALQTLNLQECDELRALPEGLSALTGLQTLNLSYCSRLQDLLPSLADLTALTKLGLYSCSAMHTPPPHVVRAGLSVVQQFLRDLRKGFAQCHLVKVVLLGDQRAGKSSLADSLKSGKPALRKEDDRTVGIDLVRWRLPASEVVSYIYDAAGERVYRATHPLFMSREALFLHVVRSVNADGTIVSECKTAVAVLEWVEAVQEEAPGAVMGVVWRHDDALDASDSRRLHESVLTRVNAEIERHVDAVDDAMRAAEADIEDDAAWREKKALRDAALDALDKMVMEREDIRESQAERGTPVKIESGLESLQNENVHFNLKVKGQDGCFVHFKIKKTTALKTLMQVYCARQGLEMSTTCFLFDGKKVRETQTPAETNMQDDDVIYAGDDGRGWRLKGSTLSRLQELTAQVTSLHHEMQDLEKQRSRHAGEQQSLEDSKMRLERLRRQRVLRPRILLSYAVSSKTGRGLEQLRRALPVLMQNEVLFPHVGMKVPLNYAMLERAGAGGPRACRCRSQARVCCVGECSHETRRGKSQRCAAEAVWSAPRDTCPSLRQRRARLAWAERSCAARSRSCTLRGQSCITSYSTRRWCLCSRSLLKTPSSTSFVSRAPTMSTTTSEKWMRSFGGGVLMVELRSIGF